VHFNARTVPPCETLFSHSYGVLEPECGTIAQDFSQREKISGVTLLSLDTKLANTEKSYQA